MENKVTSKLAKSNVCLLCEMDQEDTFYAFCICPLTAQLWRAMRKELHMTNVKDVSDTGADWLVHLMANCDEQERLPLPMTIWRIQNVRNEIVHRLPLVHTAEPHRAYWSREMVVTYDNGARNKKKH